MKLALLRDWQQYPLERKQKAVAVDDDHPPQRTLLAATEAFHGQLNSLENTQGARRQQLLRLVKLGGHWDFKTRDYFIFCTKRSSFADLTTQVLEIQDGVHNARRTE